MKQLIRIQNGLKGNLEKAYISFKRTDDSKKGSTDISERIKQVQDLWERFQKTHFEIMESDSNDDDCKDTIEQYDKSNLYEEFESSYFMFIGELNEL